jgi:anti-anti-sigma regulatory factor
MGLTALPYLADFARGGQMAVLLPTVVSAALALAIIASIDALLCAKLVTAPGEPRPNGDRLLVRLGIGNLAAACLGGITGGINIGASVANRASGARSALAVLVNAAALLVAGALLFRWLGQMPRVVLSAVIMVIAVQHLDLWSLRLARGLATAPAGYRRSAALDLMVVVVVAVLSIALNIVLAVFVGVAIAVVLFVLRMSRSVIRRDYRCSAVHSRKSRTAPERMLLDRAGDAVLVLELQGALFFGTGETMVSDIEAALPRHETSCVILDLRRLTEIDSTGAQILLELKADLAQRRKALLLAAGEGTTAMQRLREVDALASLGPGDMFPDVDRAIERAEDDLLRQEGRLTLAEIPLAEIGLFTEFGPADLAAIEKHLTLVRYGHGNVVFREGEPGDELLIVTKGAASAYLRLAGGADVRLATFSPGTVFGELAILDEGTRSASVVADGELVCLVMSKADFAALSATAPSIAIRLLAAIGRELSGRLRTANRTIHQLES